MGSNTKARTKTFGKRLPRWLHNSRFSALAYVPALFGGAYVGFLALFSVNILFDHYRNPIEELFSMIGMSPLIYLSLMPDLLPSYFILSVVMIPAIFVLLSVSRSWQHRRRKFFLLGMPVAALYALGLIVFWRKSYGGFLLETPVALVLAIIAGGGAGGLIYLSIARVSGLFAKQGENA